MATRPGTRAARFFRELWHGTGRAHVPFCSILFHRHTEDAAIQLHTGRVEHSMAYGHLRQKNTRLHYYRVRCAPLLKSRSANQDFLTRGRPAFPWHGFPTRGMCTHILRESEPTRGEAALPACKSGCAATDFAAAKDASTRPMGGTPCHEIKGLVPRFCTQGRARATIAPPARP